MNTRIQVSHKDVAGYIHILWLILLIGLAFLSFGTSWYILHSSKNEKVPKALCERCNVVIIDIDILRADEIQCWRKDTLTPNLCKLVKHSTYFNRNYSQAYWTRPSMLSTYTSLYPNVLDKSQESGLISPDVMTLAEYLKDFGYRRFAVGMGRRYTLAESNDGLRGYSEIVNTDNPGDWKVVLEDALTEDTPLFSHFYSDVLHMPYLLSSDQTPVRDLPKPEGFPVREEDYLPIWRQYLASHVSYVFKPETIAEHPEIFQAPQDKRGKAIADYFTRLDFEHDITKRYLSWDAVFNSYMQFINMQNPSDLAYLRMMYETKLHYLDKELAEVIDYLLKPEIAQRTIVVLTSPHGEAFGEHGIVSHDMSPYNTLHHVPLAVMYPGGEAQRIDAVTENIDIVPTILDLVGGTVLHRIQGVSLVPVLTGARDEAKSFAISMDGTLYSIQDARYKLIVGTGEKKTVELYDLSNDPDELINIASANTALVEHYRKLLTKAAVPELDLYTIPVQIPDEEVRDDLIRTGYF